MTAESNAQYSRGHLLFMRGDTLVAQPFDPDRLQFTGDAVIARRASEQVRRRDRRVSVSETGTLDLP
jgi:hypothetical protein